LIFPVSSEEAEAFQPGFFQKKPMKIQKIEASDALKPGQLLATRSGWRLLGSVALTDLESGNRQFQFYRHRRDPVPGIHRPKRRRIFRRPKTANERRAGFAAPKNRESIADPELAYTVRKKRSPHRLPDVYDDVFIHYQRSWKEHRRNQWKKVGLINRQVHAPPFWTSIMVRIKRTPKSLSDLRRCEGSFSHSI
jgi:hypothetical protein